jgi:hypothetical protein
MTSVMFIIAAFCGLVLWDLRMLRMVPWEIVLGDCWECVRRECVRGICFGRCRRGICGSGGWVGLGRGGCGISHSGRSGIRPDRGGRRISHSGRSGIRPDRGGRRISHNGRGWVSPDCGWCGICRRWVCGRWVSPDRGWCGICRRWVCGRWVSPDRGWCGICRRWICRRRVSPGRGGCWICGSWIRPYSCRRRVRHSGRGWVSSDYCGGGIRRCCVRWCRICDFSCCCWLGVVRHVSRSHKPNGQQQRRHNPTKIAHDSANCKTREKRL